MLVSFIKWHGWRRLKDAFEVFARAGKKLRVLTTTYMGATDREALDAIARLPGAEVRVSFDARRTRLHAKAWLFHRATGFSSVYVGSANLSAAALSDGLEWNLKASEAESRAIVEKFRGAFESLWEDGEFERYHPDQADAGAATLGGAVLRARGGKGPDGALLRPAARTNTSARSSRSSASSGRCTAAGRIWSSPRRAPARRSSPRSTTAAQVRDGVRPRLLFVAHREEILEQALHAFRNVLRDHDFGELLKGGGRPQSYEHLFATIQSLDRKDLVAAVGPEYWRPRGRRRVPPRGGEDLRGAARAVRPRILLGLTATPERADGLDVLGWFDRPRRSRHPALARAREAAPRAVRVLRDRGRSLARGRRWRRGGYDLAGLDQDLHRERRARAAGHREAPGDSRATREQARGLGFCVCVAHAEFMARKFTEAGIPSLAIHGSHRRDERDDAPAQARTGRGLRSSSPATSTTRASTSRLSTPSCCSDPTESATLFLQQLGRGLRLHRERRRRSSSTSSGSSVRSSASIASSPAMTGVPRGHLRRAVEDGFPTLPSGCHLQLERVARSDRGGEPQASGPRWQDTARAGAEGPRPGARPDGHARSVPGGDRPRARRRVRGWRARLDHP